MKNNYFYLSNKNTSVWEKLTQWNQKHWIRLKCIIKNLNLLVNLVSLKTIFKFYLTNTQLVRKWYWFGKIYISSTMSTVMSLQKILFVCFQCIFFCSLLCLHIENLLRWTFFFVLCHTFIEKVEDSS